MFTVASECEKDAPPPILPCSGFESAQKKKKSKKDPPLALLSYPLPPSTTKPHLGQFGYYRTFWIPVYRELQRDVVYLYEQKSIFVCYLLAS
jgi:hypothetical protein